MHDIDRTQMEAESEEEGYANEELWGTFNEAEAEEEAYGGSVLSEEEEMEFASALLEVENEEELEEFLGDAFRFVKRKVGQLAKTDAGKFVVKGLKAAAKKALPALGGVAGGWIGGPAGAALGAKFGGLAGKALGLEAEALEQEDLEFEGAKQFSRMTADAMQKALAAPAGANPQAVAQQAVVSAVKRYAPGLLGRARNPATQRGRSGRWYLTRDKRIVLTDVPV